MSAATFSARPAVAGMVALVLAAFLWGTVPIATSSIYRLADTTALSIGFFRLAFSTPVLVLAAVHATRGRSWRLPPRDLSLIILFGAGMALYQVAYFAAIPLIGVTVAALLTLCTAPVMVAALSGLFLREWPSGQVVLAMVAAIAGTTLLVGSGAAPETTAGLQGRGVLLALGAALGFTIVALSGRGLAGRYHALQLIAIGMLVGALLLLPFAAQAGLTRNYPPAGWLLLLYLGLVPTAIGYFLFFYGLSMATATVATIVNLLEPLTSAVLAWLLFGERLGPLGAVGAACLLGAMALLYPRSGQAS